MAGDEDQCGVAVDAGDTALLAARGVPATAIRAAEPLTGGISGARVLRLLLACPVGPDAASYHAHRVYKRIAPESGWLGAASHDTLMRELRLHSTGLLANLPAGVATAVLSHTQSGTDAAQTDGALLLDDERGHLLRTTVTRPSGHLSPAITAILARLARLHARYWDDPRLADPALGLTSSRDALLLIAPARIEERIAAGDPNPYLPLARAGWSTFFQLADPSDSALLQLVLVEPVPYITAIDALPHTLVHGDIWGPNLGWLPPTRQAPRRGWRLLLLDWALATASPCTYDPLWLCGTWHALNPVRVLAAYRANLNHALSVRGLRLPSAIWSQLADAGYLRTALTCGEALGRAAEEAAPGMAHDRAVDRVRWWARRAALAARRLVP